MRNQSYLVFLCQCSTKVRDQITWGSLHIVHLPWQDAVYIPLAQWVQCWKNRTGFLYLVGFSNIANNKLIVNPICNFVAYAPSLEKSFWSHLQSLWIAVIQDHLEILAKLATLQFHCQRGHPGQLPTYCVAHHLNSSLKLSLTYFGHPCF